MALYSLARPCDRCHANAWRLIGRTPDHRVELTCVHCGTNRMIPEEIRGGEGTRDPATGTRQPRRRAGKS